MLLTAFIFGITGSLHCAGMCGAIAISLGGSSRFRILYNIGRVITYSILGIVVGLFAETLRLSGFQRSISLGIGVFCFLVFIVSMFSQKQIVQVPFVSTVITMLRNTVYGQSSRSMLLKSFVGGILNALLPCGIVYAALGYALLQPSIIQSVVCMLMFGLGTVPMMFLVGTIKQYIPQKVFVRASSIIPIIRLGIAVLFILRGLALDIPYISPTVPTSVEVLASLKNDGHCMPR